jgi:hypothetical protein
MLCAWRDCFTTDDGNFNLSKDSFCFLDIPVAYKIPPLKNRADFLSVKTTVPFKEWREKIFRIGFNLIMRDTSKTLFSQAEELRKMKNIIWSDTLWLKEFHRF